MIQFSYFVPKNMFATVFLFFKSLIEWLSQFLKIIKVAVILSQPRPDIVSAATRDYNKSSTTFLADPLLFKAYLTISMIPWLFST
jgi:hypothetical protein